MKDKPMELILIILLLVVLFGGGFGFYRGGYYRRGGRVGIGGILGLILVVLAIGWLVHGHIGGLSLSFESLAGHGVIGQERIVIGLEGTS
jgi:hypothetical protein